MAEGSNEAVLAQVQAIIDDEQALEAHRLRSGEGAALSVQAMRSEAFVRIANLFLEQKLY